MRILKFGLLAVLATPGVAGCASYDTTKDYDGPTSTIIDTAVPDAISSSTTYYFFVSKISGQKVSSSVASSTQASWAAPLGHTRANLHHFPAQPAVISIVGGASYTMPISAFFNKDRGISGDVSFTPVAGEVYYVRGSLGEAGSSVWIEDHLGVIQGKKLESGAAGPTNK